nr:serine/arginine repetitive matrix protein 2-like [Danio rerio]|eukprot:XP_017210096.1 serine/arginine repetitive matrix protein 2-like [Danio rerio]
MTRLDRTSPRGWTEGTQSRRDGFGQFGISHGGVKDRGERESGYFSLGRAAGGRALRDQSPAGPYRHSERGHPLPSNKSPEPKAAIPFRNPDLGVPSERRTSEFQNIEQYAESLAQFPPEPLDLTAEIEALAGPRALSPTPFKQAESYSSSSRRGGQSRNTSPLRQPGSLNTSHRGSSLLQSSSPSQSLSPFRRAESSSSINTVGLRSSGASYRQDRASVSPTRSSYTAQKNLRSLASTVGTVSKSLSYMDLKGSQQKHGTSSRSGSPPSRRSYDSPTARKPDIKNLSYDRLNSSISTSRYDSRSQSPSRQSYEGRKAEIKSPSHERSHDRQSSSFSTKGRYSSRSQSPSGRPEDGQSPEGRRSASPVRKGYGTPSQSEPRSVSNRWRDERTSPAPTRKNYEGQTTMKKTEANSRHSSPNRGSSLFRKPETSSNHGPKSRSTSPLAPSPSVLRNSESGRSQSVSTLRRDLVDHIPMRSDRPSSNFRNSAGTQPRHDPIPSTDRWKGSAHSLHSQSASRHPSPTRHSGEKKQISFTQSVPVGWGVPQDSGRRSSSRPGHQEHTSRTSPLKTHTSTPSGRRHRSPSPPVQTHTSIPNSRRHRSPSPPVQTHNSTPSRQRHRSPSPPVQTHNSTPSSRRHRSPSPPAQTHTSSQSSMDSESSHLSAGSSGLNREEYAMMADLPKVKTVFQRESPSHPMRSEKREQSRYKPASHSHSKAPHSEWEDLEEDRESGTLSRAHSSSSLHTQGLSRPAAEHTHSSRSSGQKQKTHRPSVYFSCSVDQTDEEPVEQIQWQPVFKVQ